MKWCLPAFLFLPQLMGCGEQTVQPCDEPVCRQAEVVRVFETTPDRLPQALRTLADPVEQMALVRHFVQRPGADLDRLCAAVPSDMASMAHECGRMLVRPHLRTAVDQAGKRDASAAPRPGPGPAWPALRPAVPLDNPWLDTVPTPAACSSDALQDTCQHRAALAAAAKGDAPSVAAACMAVPAGRWRHECFFDAVKTFAVDWQVDRIEGAVSLCRGAGTDWLDLCLERAVTNRNGEAHDGLIPPLGAPTDPRWPVMVARADAANAALQDHAPGLADAVVGRLWARVAGRAAALASTLPTGPLQGWPPVVQPHLRAAVAWERWRRTHEGPQTPPEVRAWTTDAPGEEWIPAVHYFYGDRRAVSADPQVDAWICRLEAAARWPAGEAGPSVLVKGAAHTDPLVQWTAARLLGRLAHPDRVAPGASLEPDPAQQAQVIKWKELRASAAARIARERPPVRRSVQ